MTESNDLLAVKLTPALMLECKATVRKALYFFAYTNIIAILLYTFGFGPNLLYSLLFCNCATGCSFGLVLLSIRIFKPSRLTAMVMRISCALLVGAILGAGLFATITGIGPTTLFGSNLHLLLRMIFFCLVFVPMLIFFFMSREHISEAKRVILEEKIRNLDMKNVAMETELKLLQAQIEPHFLFNTLSNIMSLIDTDPEKAKQMMEHFCAFLRGGIHIARDRAVPISQEIELITNYLNIHRVRMGNRLHYSIDINDRLLDFRIPPLLIQPLVENSIKHGLEPRIEGGEIAIKGEITKDRVRITVADSGIGIDENASGAGIGLENIRKRIYMFCNQDGLILEENKPSGLRAIIEIPHEPH